LAANFNIRKITSVTSASTERLKGITEPLWKILTFSPADDTISSGKIVSVSLEKGVMSVAYGSRFLSRVKIKGIRRYEFEEGKYPPPEGVASSLSLAINDFGAQGASVSLCIPKAWAVIKTAEFPATVKESLVNAISYELDRITPFSHEDALYDFRVVKESDNKITVVIVAAREDTVRPYIEALKNNGIITGKVNISLSGTGALFQYVYKTKDFIFLEIGKDSYEGGLFLDSLANAAFTGNFDTDEESSQMDSLKERIGHLVSAAQKRSKSPSLVVLFRDRNPIPEDALKPRFNLPVRIVNESDIPFRQPGYHKEIPYSAIGGTLESLLPYANGLNLIRKGYQEKTRTPMTFTGVLVLVLLAVWVIYMLAPLRIEGKRLEEIERQVQIRKEDVRKVEALKEEISRLESEISLIEEFKKSSPMSLDILRELTTIIPKNTWLTRVRISGPAVNIEGYAASASTLLPKLEASAYFKKAEFASPTFRDTRMNADRFNIKVEIEGISQAMEKGKKQ